MLPPYRRKQGAIDDPVADFAEAVRKVPYMHGRLLTDLQMDGTSDVNWFRHGLEQTLRGGWSIGQTHELVPVVVMSPEAVRANGRDPSAWIGLRQAAAGSPAKVSVWVF